MPPAMGTTVYRGAPEGQLKSQREGTFSDMSEAPFTIAGRHCKEQGACPPQRGSYELNSSHDADITNATIPSGTLHESGSVCTALCTGPSTTPCPPPIAGKILPFFLTAKILLPLARLLEERRAMLWGSCKL